MLLFAEISELDEKNGGAGCELTEFEAHRFLEQLDETQTVKEMRATLRDVDIVRSFLCFQTTSVPVPVREWSAITNAYYH